MRPPVPWLRKYWAVLVLVVAGVILMLIGILERQDSLARIAIGAGLLLVGVFADRLQGAKVGPGGAEIQLEVRAAESTTELREAANLAHAPSFPDSDQVVDMHRAALASDVMRLLTEPREGPLVDCAFQLYLFDADENMLLPALEPAHDQPSPPFRVGEGVTGRAWESGQFTIAEGIEASDGTYSLSVDKQQRYADLAAVAAMPVTNAAGEVIAVLSASTTDAGSGLTGNEGFEAFVALADAVARVLVDLLKWFSDGYDDE
jgi:hypothetical protein